MKVAITHIYEDGSTSFGAVIDTAKLDFFTRIKVERACIDREENISLNRHVMQGELMNAIDNNFPMTVDWCLDVFEE